MDALQQLYILLMLGTPVLNAELKVGPHKGRAKGDYHLPVPAGHTSSGGAQDTICFPSCKSTLLAHVKFVIHQDPQVLLCRAALKDCSFKSVKVPLSGIPSFLEVWK